MMYSQKDPSYSATKLGKGGLTIASHGCFLCSIATLYQADPLALLRVRGGIVWNGDADSNALAKECGGKALGRKNKPVAGWQIAVTDHYKKTGYATHFFCFNSDTNEQIDPLVYPCRREPLSYRIIEYRPFSNLKLDFTLEDLRKRLTVAEDALARTNGLRKSALIRFIERGTKILDRILFPPTR